jgi:hypothetical protein
MNASTCMEQQVWQQIQIAHVVRIPATALHPHNGTEQPCHSGMRTRCTQLRVLTHTGNHTLATPSRMQQQVCIAKLQGCKAVLVSRAAMPRAQVLHVCRLMLRRCVQLWHKPINQDGPKLVQQQRLVRAQLRSRLPLRMREPRLRPTDSMTRPSMHAHVPSPHRPWAPSPRRPRARSCAARAPTAVAMCHRT